MGCGHHAEFYPRASITSPLPARASLGFYNDWKLLLVIKRSQHGSRALSNIPTHIPVGGSRYSIYMEYFRIYIHPVIYSTSIYRALLCARCGSKAFGHISEPKGKDSPFQANRQTINKKHNRKVNCTVFSKVVSAEQRRATTGKGKKGLGLRARGAVVTWSSQGEPH